MCYTAWLIAIDRPPIETNELCVNILYRLRKEEAVEVMQDRYLIGDTHHSTISDILRVSADSETWVWVLDAAGDYIHPAASRPRGGQNVIFTLIVPAPLSTPPK